MKSLIFRKGSYISNKTKRGRNMRKVNNQFIFIYSLLFITVVNLNAQQKETVFIDYQKRIQTWRQLTKCRQ